MDIFVGNLLYEATEGAVKKLFEGFGNVASAEIVMRKGKSRGFGFVEMPDEQQALAAIAGLNDKEFMGRVLHVEPARPKGQKAMVWPPIAKAKKEVQQDNRFRPVKDGQVRPLGQHLALKDRQVRPLGQPGRYRGGRRTRSYMRRLGLDGMQEEAKPRPRSQYNPLRWRKKKDKSRPWQKSPQGHKPWEKPKEGARPWKKTEGESKPWRKSEGGIKPWKKPAGDTKPWSKSSERPQKSRFRGRKKPGGYKRRS